MQCVDGSNNYTCICRTVGFFSYFGKNCSMSKHYYVHTYTHTHTHTHTYTHTHARTHAHTHTARREEYIMATGHTQ